MMMEDTKPGRVQVGLFDFDGTLFRGDSFIQFGICAVGKNGFGLAFIKAIPWLVSWKLGMISSSCAKEKFFGFLFKGMEKTEFDRKCRRFATEIDRMLRLDVLRDMETLRKDGGRIVIVTASIEDWIRPWAVRHGVEKVIGTKVEVGQDGRLTGRFLTRNCQGEEKAKRIRLYLTEMPEADGNECVFLGEYDIHAWGNLPEDEAMLAMADNPHTV